MNSCWLQALCQKEYHIEERFELVGLGILFYVPYFGEVFYLLFPRDCSQEVLLGFL